MASVVSLKDPVSVHSLITAKSCGNSSLSERVLCAVNWRQEKRRGGHESHFHSEGLSFTRMRSSKLRYISNGQGSNDRLYYLVSQSHNDAIVVHREIV